MYLGDVPGEPLLPPMRLPRERSLRDAVLAVIPVVALALASAAFLLCAFALAFAHGPAEWIQRGGYKNSAGELCCGERDCIELTDADVKVTPQGYRIPSTGELIPFEDATPSPTGTYWRCQWGGMRKCFFAPPGAA